MKKLSVIYWSGTGDTAYLAKTLANSVKGEDIQVEIKSVEVATIEDIMYADYIALGCPAYTVPSDAGGEMEALEDKHMQPFINKLKDVDLSGKKVGLFGTYDWGNGQWMEEWENQMNYYNISLIDKGLAIQKDDPKGEEKIKDFGKKLINTK